MYYLEQLPGPVEEVVVLQRAETTRERPEQAVACRSSHISKRMAQHQVQTTCLKLVSQLKTRPYRPCSLAIWPVCSQTLVSRLYWQVKTLHQSNNRFNNRQFIHLLVREAVAVEGEKQICRWYFLQGGTWRRTPFLSFITYICKRQTTFALIPTCRLLNFYKQMNI